MRRVAVCLLAVAAMFLGIIGTGSTAGAAPGDKTLTVSPATTKPTIDPGASIHGTFQIINQGEQDFSVTIYSAPYSVQGEEYTPDFTALPGHANVADWLKFTTAGADSKPGQALTVGYTLSVPAGTQPGGYYAVAFAETKAPPNQGVVINERVGEIFYITVSGPVKQAGKLTSWSVPFLQKQPLTSTVRLENDGGVHYASNVQIVVSDVFGRAKFTLNTQKEILPETIRRIPATWANAPPLGLFKVTGSATIVDAKEQLPTRYVLVMAPAVRIIFAGIILLILLFGLYRLLRRRRRAHKRSPAPDMGT
ncbi:MAG: hypothetical protein WDN27_00415 [Candidatus Saccharibacteria bacterium]